MKYLRKFNILRLIWMHPLNSNRRVEAILFFLRFQILGRVRNSRIDVEWIHGLHFFIAPGETGMTINYYCGMSEPNEMLFMLHFLQAGDIFFDIGANAGSYSLLAAGISNCKVYSFEPVLHTRLRLIENLVLNGLPTDSVQSCALGSSQGKIQFTKSLDAVNHVVRASEVVSSDLVDQQTLDSYADVLGVSLIKIDVEGYEMEILRGASRFLKNSSLQALIVETNGETKYYGSSDSEIAIFLNQYGFKPFAYNPLQRCLTPLDQPNRVGNTIFIRDLNFAMRRTIDGPKIAIREAIF